MKNITIISVLLTAFSNAFAIGPTVTGVKPISSLGHNVINNGQEITSSVTELEITFSEEMIDQVGDDQTVDVTNPNNYRLYSTTDDAVVLPIDCSAMVPANVTQTTLIPGFYDNFSNIIALTVSTTTGLSRGRYRLMGCNAGLQSLAVATFLDGNGDGTPGDDYVLDFSIKYNNLLINPNLTQMVNNGWDITSDVFDGFQDVDGALLQASAQLDPDTATNNDTVISQCVAISGTNKMLFGASITGYFGNGTTTLKVEYNDDNVCAGIVIATFSSASNYTADLDPNTSEPIWTDVSFNTTVPIDALSAKVSISIDSAQASMLMDRAYFVSTLDHLNLSVDENITVTDDVILLPSISLDITENILVSDDVVLLPSISLDILENIVVNDDIQILLPIDLFINENITVTDDVVLLPSINLDISEMIVVTDGVVLLPSLSLDISEIITVTDALTYWTPAGNVVDVVLDADDAIVAGSAYLDVPSTISQCVAISGVKAVRFGTSLIADSNPTQGQLSIEYFNQANCQGETTGIQSNIKTATTGNWRNFALDSRVPASSLSARVTVEALNSQTPFMLDRTFLIESDTSIYKNSFEDEPATQSCALQ